MNQLIEQRIKSSFMKKMMCLGLFITAAFIFSWTASAQPYLDDGGNADLWYAETFRDALANHSFFLRQEICVKFVGVVGTQRRYIWWSLTYAGWKGEGTQEGDQVMMYGLWANNNWNDAWFLEISTEDSSNRPLQGGGHWWIWNFDNSSNYYLNVVLMRRAVDECQSVVQDNKLNKSRPELPVELHPPK